MSNYRGVSEETGLEVIRPSASYREVLDTARSLAQREAGNVVIMNGDTRYMIVHPDGRVVSANKHHRSP